MQIWTDVGVGALTGVSTLSLLIKDVTVLMKGHQMARYVSCVRAPHGLILATSVTRAVSFPSSRPNVTFIGFVCDYTYYNVINIVQAPSFLILTIPSCLCAYIVQVKG